MANACLGCGADLSGYSSKKLYCDVDCKQTYYLNVFEGGSDCLDCGKALTRKNAAIGKIRQGHLLCRVCSNKRSRKTRKRWQKKHPILYKAQKMAAGLNIKRDELVDLVTSSIGEPCKYCKEELNLEVMGLDHIQPKSRDGSDSLKNLQIICQPCNRKKASLNDKEFKALLRFLEKWPDMKGIVLARMAMGGIHFGKSRK